MILKKQGLTCLILLLMITTLALSGCTEDGGNEDQVTPPADVFREYLSMSTSGDMEGALELTDIKFSDNYTEYKKDIIQNNSLGDLGSIQLNSIETKYEEDLTGDVKRYIQTVISKEENRFGIDVEDYAVLYINYSVKGQSGSQTLDLELLSLKIDGDWYLGFWFMIPKEDDPDTQSNFSLETEKTGANEWKITIEETRVLTELYPTDLSYAIRNGDGQILVQYQPFPDNSGVTDGNGMTWNDRDGDSKVSPGDILTVSNFYIQSGFYVQISGKAFGEVKLP